MVIVINGDVEELEIDWRRRKDLATVSRGGGEDQRW